MMRVVVIGTGFGEYVAAPVYRDLGMEVEVVSPRDTAALQAALAQPADLVSIHSPPFLHAEHVNLALDRGYNVLCEKPFGSNAGEARQMLERATAAGVLHFINCEFRHDPVRIKLKQLLDAGEIGAPAHINWTAFNSGGRYSRHKWLFEQGKGGWIGAFGSHAIDTLRWLFGDIATVSGQVRTEVKIRRDSDKTSDKTHPSTAEDAFTAWFRHANGVTATLDTAYAAAVTVTSRITIFGETGAIEIADSSELTIHKPKAAPVKITFPVTEIDPHLPALRPWLATVRDALIDKRQIAPNFADGVAMAAAMDAIKASASATSAQST